MKLIFMDNFKNTPSFRMAIMNPASLPVILVRDDGR